jgi:hypothetical protein
MRVLSSKGISGFLKIYRLHRWSCWLGEGEEARVEPGGRTTSAGGACACDGAGPGGVGDRRAGRIRARPGRRGAGRRPQPAPSTSPRPSSAARPRPWNGYASTGNSRKPSTTGPTRCTWRPYSASPPRPPSATPRTPAFSCSREAGGDSWPLAAVVGPVLRSHGA